MKNILFNLSASAVAFYIPFQIALLTDIGLVKNAVLIAFAIQWVLFIPAYLMQTEKFYDLAGSLTYISIISYVFYKSSEFNLGNLIFQFSSGSAITTSPSVYFVDSEIYILFGNIIFSGAAGSKYLI